MGFWDTSCPVISAQGRLKQEDSRLSGKEERVMGVQVGVGGGESRRRNCRRREKGKKKERVEGREMKGRGGKEKKNVYCPCSY